ncbi:MAG: thiamine phosphate synthase [Acidimicrobiales bacterium]
MTAAMAVPDHRLHLVTDTTLCGSVGVAATVAAALAGGVTVVQVRDPQASTRQLLDLAWAVTHELQGTGVPLVVNDRLDVALAAGADGVHLGQSDLPPEDARRLARAAGVGDLLIGWSAATDDDLRRLGELPAGTVDYLGSGPVWSTSTKDAGPAIGLDRLAAVCRAVSLPVVAIGGVTPANAAACRAAGAAGVAVVSAICGQPDPAAATRAVRAGFESAP